MKVSINTTRFGEVEVQNDQLLTFESGIIGFPEHKQFALIEKKSDSPFIWLQCTTNAEVAFIIVDPDHINPEYVFVPTKSELSEIDLKSVDEADIYVVITVPEDPHDMSANLKAPILVNPISRASKQIILNQSHITTRHYLLKDTTEGSNDSSNAKKDLTSNDIKIMRPFRDLTVDR